MHTLQQFVAILKTVFKCQPYVLSTHGTMLPMRSKHLVIAIKPLMEVKQLAPLSPGEQYLLQLVSAVMMQGSMYIKIECDRILL